MTTPSSISQLLAHHLRQHGYSMTKGRALVFDLLWQQPPLSMTELFERLEGRLDRASLYRITDVFEKIGVVTRVTLGWKYKLELSELFSHHHHHLTCMRCGQVVVLPDSVELETHIEQLGRAQGFSGLLHQLELQGYCYDCSRRQTQ